MSGKDLNNDQDKRGTGKVGYTEKGRRSGFDKSIHFDFSDENDPSERSNILNDVSYDHDDTFIDFKVGVSANRKKGGNEGEWEGDRRAVTTEDSCHMEFISEPIQTKRNLPPRQPPTASKDTESNFGANNLNSTAIVSTNQRAQAGNGAVNELEPTVWLDSVPSNLNSNFTDSDKDDLINSWIVDLLDEVKQKFIKYYQQRKEIEEMDNLFISTIKSIEVVENKELIQELLECAVDLNLKCKELQADNNYLQFVSED